jgi:uncharacterized membrane protein YphA (DoxX/SURF4 family)
MGRPEEIKNTSNIQPSTLNDESRAASSLNVAGWSSGVRRLLWRIDEWAIGAVFIGAGALKASDPISFANDIENYHILPWPAGVRLAFYLPWLEMLCGLFLVCGFLRKGAAALLSLLLIVFIGASVIAKARGIDVSCGCFGHASRTWSFTGHLLVDLTLLAMLLTALLHEHRSRG